VTRMIPIYRADAGRSLCEIRIMHENVVPLFAGAFASGHKLGANKSRLIWSNLGRRVSTEGQSLTAQVVITAANCEGFRAKISGAEIGRQAPGAAYCGLIRAEFS